jgi:hypothetical protein
VISPNLIGIVQRDKMWDSWVGCLSKTSQEGIGAAMEAATRDGSTRLGRRRAIALKKRGPFSNFLQVSAQCWPTQSQSICLYLT